VVQLEPGPKTGTSCVVRNGLGESHRIETRLLRPVAYGAEIQRYDRVVPQRFLVFPYESGEAIPEHKLKKEYPQGYRYFCDYRDLLTSRTSINASGRSWYELVRDRDPSWLESQKLLMRDMATVPSFAIDDEGATYLVGGTAVVPTDLRVLRPLLGYLNSKVVSWYLRYVAPGFRAGFQKFEPQHLGIVPVPRAITDDDTVVDELSRLVSEVVEARGADDESAQRIAEHQIDALICRITGVAPEEVL
jgi:hypothetical protein